MKKAIVSVKYNEEKLNAIRQYMVKKEVDFENELNEMLNRLYEKYVPQTVREYIDSKGDVPPEIKKVINAQTKKGTISDGGLPGPGNQMSD